MEAAYFDRTGRNAPCHNDDTSQNVGGLDKSPASLVLRSTRRSPKDTFVCSTKETGSCLELAASTSRLLPSLPCHLVSPPPPFATPIKDRAKQTQMLQGTKVLSPLDLVSRTHQCVESRRWLYRVGSHVHAQSHGLNRSSHLWSRENFDVRGGLGKGKFGMVYMANDIENGTNVALKRVSKEKLRSSQTAPRLLQREIEIQTRLQHDQILHLFGYFHDRKHVTLVLEYASMGDLYRYVNQLENGVLPLDRAAIIIRQVATALAYLNSHFVAHRDVKPENIVLIANNTVKLCDFGWAVHAPPPSHDCRRTLCGTPEYVPPEMITLPSDEIEYEAQYVDPWALGVLAYELVIGRSPFFVRPSEQKRVARAKGYDILHEVVFDKIRNFTELQKPVEDAFFSFCGALMQRNPCGRMSAADALHHPWLRTSTASCSNSGKRPAIDRCSSQCDVPVPSPKRANRNVENWCRNVGDLKSFP